jgi:hypothetical protein
LLASIVSMPPFFEIGGGRRSWRPSATERLPGPLVQEITHLRTAEQSAADWLQANIAEREELSKVGH